MDPLIASPLPAEIDDLWARRADLNPSDAAARALVVEAVDQLDQGFARVAWVDPASDAVVVDERAKRAILLSFKVLAMHESSAGDFRYYDRMPLKTRLDGVRVVPGAIVRWGAFVAPGAVLLPSFVNIGGYVDEGSMVDTWATVGSCAQVGKRVHLVGWGRARRRTGATKRGPCCCRGRRVHRVALDGGRRRSGTSRREARSWLHPDRVDPCVRRG